jgi:uncharacterized protein
MRLLPLLVLAIILGTSFGPAMAEPVLSPLGLYSGRTVVSGRGEENRKTGASACLVDVLVKVSGDPTVATDPRVQAFAGQAIGFADSFEYRDRLEGRPLHDEQGSYDRPHYLTVSFPPGKIATLLRSLGRVPWVGERPRILAVIDVRGRKASFALVSDEDVDVSADMRAALAAAGERSGMVVLIPSRSDLARLASPVAKREPAPAGANGAGGVLKGSLVWSDAAMGWIARWRTTWKGHPHAWTARGVNFDEAFRRGVAGMARVASGQAPPNRR